MGLYDKDGDGTILSTNLATVMRCLGLNPTKKELESMINEVDVNGDGQIDFDEEFLPLMSRKMKDVVDEDELVSVFKEFDRRGDGLISALELRHLMTTCGQTLTEDQVDEMIVEVGCDDNGYVNYLELVKMILHGGSKKY